MVPQVADPFECTRTHIPLTGAPRHHHPVPLVDPASYRLCVDGTAAGGRKVELDLDALRALPQHQVTATMQCSGNRRGQMNAVKATSGTAWGQGARVGVGVRGFEGP